jgi:hypothetical protein
VNQALQLLKVLMQGLYLTKVLPSRPISLGRQGSRATIDKHRERGRIIIFQVNHFFRHPFIDLGMEIFM